MTSAGPVFLGGAPRGGLTLLGAMLGTHSRLFCGPDLNLIPTLALQWTDFRDALGELHEKDFGLSPQAVRENFAALITGLFEHALTQSGRARAVEKSPVNALVFRQLRLLFPGSPLIHVIRDGRDVVASLLQTGWKDPRTGRSLPYTRDAAHAARLWLQYIQTVRAAGADEPSDRPIIEVRYEDLVTKPHKTLATLCSAIDEPFELEMLAFGQKQNRRKNLNHPSFHALRKRLHTKSIGAWRDRLAPAQVDQVRQIAGPMLIELGYCDTLDWSSQGRG